MKVGDIYIRIKFGTFSWDRILITEVSSGYVSYRNLAYNGSDRNEIDDILENYKKETKLDKNLKGL